MSFNQEGTGLVRKMNRGIRMLGLFKFWMDVTKEISSDRWSLINYYNNN